MKYYYLNKFLYLISNDWRIKHIEEILRCEIVNQKGRYYGKYISYLIKADCDESKIEQLEHTLKHHCEIVRKDYYFILKVFHYPLCKYCEYEYHESKDMILGIGYHGLVRVPINSEVNNYLIVGASGSGKSCLAQSIIYNLIQNHVECWICDNKSSYDYDFLDAPLYKGILDCIKIINKFEIEIDKRMKENKRHKPLLIVIDEIFPLLTLDSKDKKRIYNQLALIMSKCRSVNCHVLIVTQRATTDIIDSKILANISNRICLQTSSKQESINVLSDDRAFYINTVGKGILSINGHTKEFQSYYLDKTKLDIKEHIEDVTLAEDKRKISSTQTKRKTKFL